MEQSTLTRGARPTPLPIWTVLACGLGFGVLVDLLLRSSEGPGLNFLLLFLGLAAGIMVVSRRDGLVLHREAVTSMAVGLLMAGTFALRASATLQVLAFLGAAAAFALPALMAGAAWMRRAGVAEPVEAVVGAVTHAALGTLRLATDRLSRPRAPSPTAEGRRRVAWGVARGVLLAAPLLVVFGALFVAADRVFARLLTDFVNVDFQTLFEHVAVIGIFGWLATGYFTGFLTGTRLRGLLEERIERPSLGMVEVATALALVDLLFAGFVAVQFRYLFGGSRLVEVTPGLTYAEYAREGFGQLALASALVLPTLIAADWLLRRERPRDQSIFQALGGLQILLLLVVIASALQRVRAYEAAYGLTESRLYGAIFLVWLVLLSLWLAGTVLRHRRDRFTFPALVSAFAGVVLLLALNPDAGIARWNLTRAGYHLDGTPAAATGAAAAGDRPSLDAPYLASLGADAVPTLLRALPSLPPGDRCVLATELLDRWETEGEGDWRSWNLGLARARAAVDARGAELRRMAQAPGGCG